MRITTLEEAKKSVFELFRYQQFSNVTMLFNLSNDEYVKVQKEMMQEGVSYLPIANKIEYKFSNVNLVFINDGEETLEF